MQMAARSDRGKVRGNNEDAIAFDLELCAAVLADGMGGLEAGEVASAVAVDVVIRHLKECNGCVDTSVCGATLREAIRLANRAVHGLSWSRQDPGGMGTTLVVGMLCGDRFVAAHVGDSRAYRFRDGEFTRLTEDHSLVQQLVAQGVLSAEQARRAPNRNIVTRAVGIEREIECDLTEVDARSGDRFLLCSDGLTDMLDDPVIASLCELHRDDLPQRLVDALIDAALAEGGLDNVSVIVVDA